MVSKNMIEVLIIQVSSQTTCPENETEKCRESTQGRNTHTSITLQPDEHFKVLIRTLPGFDWKGYTGLQIKLDFDAGDIVNSYPTYATAPGGPLATTLMETKNDSAWSVWQNIQDMSILNGGMSEMDISGIVIPIEGDCGAYQYVRFVTQKLAEVETPSGRMDKYQGTIRVAIQRVKFQKRQPRAREFGSPRSINRASKQDLEVNGIMSEIGFSRHDVRIDCESQTFKAIPSSIPDDVGIFVFHYRVPAIFNESNDEEPTTQSGTPPPAEHSDSQLTRKRKRTPSAHNASNSVTSTMQPPSSTAIRQRNHQAARIRAPSTPTHPSTDSPSTQSLDTGPRSAYTHPSSPVPHVGTATASAGHNTTTASSSTDDNDKWEMMVDAKIEILGKDVLLIRAQLASLEQRIAELERDGSR